MSFFAKQRTQTIVTKLRSDYMPQAQHANQIQKSINFPQASEPATVMSVMAPFATGETHSISNPAWRQYSKLAYNRKPSSCPGIHILLNLKTN